MLGQRISPAGSSTDEGGVGDLPLPFPRGDRFSHASPVLIQCAMGLSEPVYLCV